MADGLRPDHARLLERIESHAFDVRGATQTFEARLADENGWTIGFARRAICTLVCGASPGVGAALAALVWTAGG